MAIFCVSMLVFGGVVFGKTHNRLLAIYFRGSGDWEQVFVYNHFPRYLGVSKNRGTPKSSILIGFSIINHPFWGFSTIFGNIHLATEMFCCRTCN